MVENESYFREDEGYFDEENDPKPLFGLGQIVGTPGVLDALMEAEQDPVELLRRHVTGDWGNLDDDDKKENQLSVRERRFNSQVRLYRLEYEVSCGSICAI